MINIKYLAEDHSVSGRGSIYEVCKDGEPIKYLLYAINNGIISLQDKGVKFATVHFNIRHNEILVSVAGSNEQYNLYTHADLAIEKLNSIYREHKLRVFK